MDEAAVIYESVWGAAPPWSHEDLTRDMDEPQEDPALELWVVFANGRLATLQQYPSKDFARAAAVGWARSYPGAVVEFARVYLLERFKVEG